MIPWFPPCKGSESISHYPSADELYPTKGVLKLTGLDAGQGVVQSARDRAGITTAQLQGLALVAEPAHRGNDGGRTAAKGFAHPAGLYVGHQFMDVDGALFDLITKSCCKFKHRVARHSGKD